MGTSASPDPKTGTNRTMVSPRSGAEVPTGAHPKNTGGKKGRSGRPSKAFLRRCLDAVEDDTLWNASRKQHALGVLKMAAEYTHGKPEQQHKHDGEIVVKVQFDGD